MLGGGGGGEHAHDSSRLSHAHLVGCSRQTHSKVTDQIIGAVSAGIAIVSHGLHLGPIPDVTQICTYNDCCLQYDIM